MEKELKHILIIGDAGRGKTTLAKKLSKILNLPIYSTDDFFWKIKFTEANNRQESINNIEKIYQTDRWIMEGSSTHLFKLGLEKADMIIILKFSNIFSQWIALIKRNIGRKNENFFDLIKFLIYVTRKRFNIGYKKEITNKELLRPYEPKTIILKSHKEIDNLFSKFERK